MSKKKKDKKKKNLVSILKENKDNITIKKGDKLVSLGDATKESIESITSCEQSSIISISAGEAADKKENVEFSVETRFSRHVFAMYEEAMRNTNVTQTICVTVTADEAEDIFEVGTNPTLSVLLERSNLGLIVKKADKMKNRLTGWLEEPGDESYIINIPEVVFFCGNIPSTGTTDAIFFNLTIQVLPYTTKELGKMRKKNKEKADDVQKKVITELIESQVSLGNVSSDILIKTDEFISDISVYVDQWKEVLDEAKRKCFNKIIFSFENDVDFIPASRVFREWVNNGYK